MEIIITLNDGLGDALGPTFDITSDVGTVNPDTATLTQLLSGVTATVDDATTTVTITSIGNCTNDLDLVIPTTTTTTTVTGSTPTTTTTTTLSTYNYDTYKYVCGTCTYYGSGISSVSSPTQLVLGGYYTLNDGYVHKIRSTTTSGIEDFTGAAGPYYTCESITC